MDTVKKFFLILCLAGLIPGSARAQKDTVEINGPDWKMAVLRKAGSEYESIPFHEPLTISRRDSYQLYLAFEGEGYCYIIQEDDTGKLPLVHRKNVSRGHRITLPADIYPVSGESENIPHEETEAHFRAEKLPGTSHLYVIVSALPRPNLERLMDQHTKEGVSSSLERSILSEVLAIRRSVSPETNVPKTSVPPAETDRRMKGEIWLFEGRDTWVVTVTVRS